MTGAHRSASFSVTIRVQLEDRPGAFAEVARAIGVAGGTLGAIDLVRVEHGQKVRDVTVEAASADHIDEIVAAVRAVPGVVVEHVSDRTFLLHLGGKIATALRSPMKTRDDFSMAYTPGVNRVATAIAEDRSRVWSLTVKRNVVAVVSDGTAVLGLGDIGPEAAMPVMEGKAILFKEFAGVDAWPICLATKDTDEIVNVVAAIASGFGAINLEDISAPRCFEIERRLRETLDIPVFHDDQHGTSIVATAAFLNALKVVGKKPEEAKVVVVGVGSAGMAISEMLLRLGVHDLVGCDRRGALHVGMEGLNEVWRHYAERTNPRRLTGSADEALAGADVMIGVSGPGAVTRAGVESMAAGAVVFAMANPVPEVAPGEIEGLAAVIATGRSDYPNQINNVLAFPGVFRGALDVRASTINEAMKLAAATAIAEAVRPDELSAEYIIPSVFNRQVAPAVATAVAAAATATGVARKPAESRSWVHAGAG
jgi:malate dehydrogenase (oxaloacetate-decarboxylating)